MAISGLMDFRQRKSSTGANFQPFLGRNRIRRLAQQLFGIDEADFGVCNGHAAGEQPARKRNTECVGNEHDQRLHHLERVTQRELEYFSFIAVLRRQRFAQAEFKRTQRRNP